MKHLLSISFILFAFIGANAQSNDEVEFFQSIWGMEKRAIVEAYMDDLSTDETTAFWPIYEAYEVSRKDLGKEKVAIMQEYAKNYGSFSGDIAKDLINKNAANSIAIQKLMKKTFKKMSKSLDPVKAAKFIQLENYFTTMIQASILESIPFVDEFE